MSKKFESIKKAVFYSQEKPELLASHIAGLITDTVSGIDIKGAISIVIPESDSVTSEYSAKALSQFGDEMNDSVTLALNESVTGVSISDSTVTVTHEASEGSFVLKATCGAITKLFEVSLVDNIEGE